MVEDYTVGFTGDTVRTPALIGKKGWANIYDAFDSVAASLVILAVLFVCLFRVVGISGPSMEDSFHDGDWVIVSNIEKGLNRGDVVIVTQPNSMQEPLIKRVIAVSGDTVNIDFVSGDVSINGEVIDEPYIKGRTHLSYDVAFPLTVPEGKLFVMGDNRMNSIDSRSSVIGFIDERYILGKVVRSIIPWKDVE